MHGRRLPDGAPRFSDVQPGDYWQNEHGLWYANTPNGLLGNLGGHDVKEHEDGTISVSPSILVSDGKAGHSWHGYLELGIWRAV